MLEMKLLWLEAFLGGRSKIEHDVGSSKKDISKSSVIELHDSPVKDTSLSLTTSVIEAVKSPLVPTTKARTYRRKTITRKAKTVRLDVESSSGKVNS